MINSGHADSSMGDKTRPHVMDFKVPRDWYQTNITLKAAKNFVGVAVNWKE